MQPFKLSRGILLMNALGWLVAGVIIGITLASWHSAEAQGPPIRLRKFYVTTTTANGAAATLACAQGFHMASLWEIFNPSGLEYDTSLGHTAADSGSSAPAAAGWIRTGENATTLATPGQGNCNAWTSASAAHNGTIVNLNTDWLASVNPVSPWGRFVLACNTAFRVWCVQD